MTVAEMIKKTRTDAKLSQDEYAKQFYVSRQTVSSWENGKSTPDLQVLIDICNTYNISLDALLNEDHKYVNKITIFQKFAKTLKGIAVFACILAIGFTSFHMYWTYKNMQMTDEYIQRLSRAGYKKDGDFYYIYDGSVTYYSGIQELPKYNFDFSNKTIIAEYRDGEDIWDFRLQKEGDEYLFVVTVGNASYIDGKITEDEIIHYTEISGLAQNTLDNHQSIIEEILMTMREHNRVIYE